MKYWCVRLIAVLGIFVALAAGTWALGGWGPRDPHPDVIKCPQPACTDVCDPSQYVTGYCTEGKQGKGAAMTYACCCCNEDAENHFFHGG